MLEIYVAQPLSEYTRSNECPSSYLHQGYVFAFVRLSVSCITQKLRYFAQIFRAAECIASNKRLDFCGYTDHESDPGILAELLLLRNMGSCKNVTSSSVNNDYSV